MSRFLVEDASGGRQAPLAQLMTIGRSHNNDLVLHSIYVSRRHAWVWRQGDQFIIGSIAVFASQRTDQALGRIQIVIGKVSPNTQCRSINAPGQMSRVDIDNPVVGGSHGQTAADGAEPTD